MLGLNLPIDMNQFNALVVKGGGKPLITKKKLISMKAFITILLKLFRKDYNLRYKKGGDTTDYGIYRTAFKYADLNYNKSYTLPGISAYERDFV